MTFEEYLTDKFGYRGKNVSEYLSDRRILQLAEDWHTQELKSMRTKGANTTNSKYSKEERSEWAKKGGYPKGRKRKPVDNSLTK